MVPFERAMVVSYRLSTVTIALSLTIRGHSSDRMSKITNDGLTRSVTGCFIAVRIW